MMRMHSSRLVLQLTCSSIGLGTDSTVCTDRRRADAPHCRQDIHSHDIFASPAPHTSSSSSLNALLQCCFLIDDVTACRTDAREGPALTRSPRLRQDPDSKGTGPGPEHEGSHSGEWT